MISDPFKHLNPPFLVAIFGFDIEETTPPPADFAPDSFEFGQERFTKAVFGGEDRKGFENFVDGATQGKRRGGELDLVVGLWVAVDVLEEVGPGAGQKVRQGGVGNPGGGVFVFGHEDTIANRRILESLFRHSPVGWETVGSPSAPLGLSI